MRGVLGLLVAAWSVVLIAWLTLHWGILPHIERWREPIERRASRAVGVPVRIGHIEVASNGWVPSLELRDVVLLDPQQRPALRLPRVAAAVSMRSLLSLQLRFEQLLIDGAELEVRRDGAGRIFVAGLDLNQPGARGDDATTDWFFAQREFVIRGGALRWVDEQRGAAPLELTDVQLIVRNGRRRHDVRLDATPPPAWGNRFTLVGRFTQPLLVRAGDWRRWSGDAYVDLPRADLRELRRHVELPFNLTEGDGALRAWLDLDEAQLRAATVDLALRAVTLRLTDAVEALAFENVHGRVTGERTPDTTTVGVQGLSFITGDNVRWPASDMSLVWQQRDGAAPTGGRFDAQRLDVGLMAQVASRVPLGAPLRKLLAELNPKGVISGFSASWAGALDAPERYSVKGVLGGLSLSSDASEVVGAVGRPGLRNASVRLDASETGGTAQLTIADGALELPGVFEEALLPLDHLSAQLAWKIEPSAPLQVPRGPPLHLGPKISVEARNVSFGNADAQGTLSGTWTTGAGSGVGRDGRYPGRLVLDSTLTQGVATRTARYLPLGITAATRHYVEHAVQGGTLARADFRVNGQLWDFPFANARSASDGEFRIAAKLVEVAFAYVPDTPASAGAAVARSAWPALARVNGELIIDRSSLEIRDASAQLGGASFDKVEGAIRDLDRAVLTLAASGRGPIEPMLQFVNTTPVGPWMNNALAQATGSGVADLKLALSIPLDDTDKTQVKGSVTLAGNDVRITPGSPLLGTAKGRVDFTNQGFAVLGASARVYGGDATFEGGSQPDASVRFTGQGSASVEGLRRAAELGDLSRIGNTVSGQAAYRVALGFVKGQAEIDITSNLVGLALDLPAPLNKAADSAWPLRYRTSLLPESLGAGATPRDLLRVELGTLLKAQYLRDLSGAVPRVLRGGIGVMEAAPSPASGVLADVNLKTLDLEAWSAAADRLLGAGGGSSASSADGRDPPAGAGGNGYVPDAWALRIGELDLGTRRLDNFVAGVSVADGLWRANLDATQLDGYVEYRPARSDGGAAGKVLARLSRLSLPKSEGDAVDSLLDQQPSSVPGLDIVVDDFELRGKHLGRLQVEAVNNQRGEGRDAVREWTLSTFSLTSPDAVFSATGRWAGGGVAGAGRRRTDMDFDLAINNSGALLERLGLPKAIRGGKGKLAGKLSWIGSPLALDYPTLAGQVEVAIDKGQFLQAEPGAARLLGVLSLQALPRRLTFDFRDLFQEGFAFDSITGNVTIAKGEASTNNLRMRGVQAVVLMEGQADIALETQDLRVWVVPEINAGTASLAYAVINPAIGLGTFLAQVVLRKQLAQAGTREFSIRGTWADPKVEQVERKMTDDVPALEPPPAPAAAASDATRAAANEAPRRPDNDAPRPAGTEPPRAGAGEPPRPAGAPAPSAPSR